MGKISRKQLFVLLLVITLLWMCLIFWFSAQNADDSGDLSTGLLKKLLSLTVPHWKDRTHAERRAIMKRFHTVFRKAGHFTEYTILGILLASTVRRIPKLITKSRQAILKWIILLPALCALLYAASDELHQRFVPGRSCELRDVCIDFSGACLGILISTAVAVHRKKRRAAVTAGQQDHTYI